MRKIFFNSQWPQIIISIGTFILGLFAQPLLESRVQPFFSPTNIPLMLFLLVSVLFAIHVVIWINTRQQVASIEKHMSALANYMGYRIQVLSPVEGYDEVRKRTRTASTEILKLVYYDIDLQSGKPVYDISILESPKRRATYLQERKKIKREKSNERFKYREILQIPYGYGLADIIQYDPIYKESYEFLVDIGSKEPEFASLRISEVIFPNTVIIIDRSFLYIAFGSKNPETGIYEYPFVGLVIEDPNSEVVKDMLKLFQRIEANSTLLKLADANADN